MMERRKKDAAAQIKVVHAESSGGSWMRSMVGHWHGPGKRISLRRHPAAIMAAITMRRRQRHVRARRRYEAGRAVAFERAQRGPVPALYRSRAIPMRAGTDLQGSDLEL